MTTHRRIPLDRDLQLPCVEWGGPMDRNGYGKASHWGQRRTAHRAVYLDAFGDPGPEFHIDHLCRNRACVRLEHLEAVTQNENQRRSLGQCWYRGSSCRRGHKWTHESTTWEDRGDGRGKRRKCKICASEARKRRRSEASA